MQHLQLGIFVVAMIAIVVCGCILRANQKNASRYGANGPRFLSRRGSRRIAADIAKLPDLLRRS
jgi:hypothetical protein